MNKVLICGHRSFVASGIEAQLNAMSIDYDVFPEELKNVKET